jgi:hypothetical protein
VKLKSYNNASNLKIHTNTTETTTTEKKDTFVKPVSKSNPNIILRENANRYSYRGKITDFSDTENNQKVLITERPAHPTTTPNPTTTTKYAEFKQQMMKSAL